MTHVADLFIAAAVVAVPLGLCAVLADVVLPALTRAFPALGRKLDAFYESLPMSRDDWDA